MAMNKTEKSAFDRLEQELREAKALRWPDENPKPDIAVPSHGRAFGWMFNSYRAASGPASSGVFKVWSEPASHGDGHDQISRSGASQQGVAMYSARLMALKALRYALCKRFAAILADVDLEIGKETAG